jgi:hypothetical protein
MSMFTDRPRTGAGEMSDLIERLRKESELQFSISLLDEAADRIEALEADIDRFVGQRDKALEFISANAHRIEALEAALNYVADMTYYGAGAEWHFKLGYDPQEVLAALAPEQEK